MPLLAPFRLVARVVRRFRAERLTQTAAALSFSTLLGLVPMIAVAAALIDLLPFAASLGASLEKFMLANLLPEKAGGTIARHVGQFAQRTERVTTIGIVMLAAMALIQMFTIEHTFDALWKVGSRRPLIRRLAMHTLALSLGPLAFGGSMAGLTYLASVSLGWVAEPLWVNALVFSFLPFASMTALFALLYWGVPNRAVTPWHAVFGGLLAAGGFVLMQWLFGLYLTNFPTYKVIYGAFAALPIFLSWLFLSWTVILLGALVTAELPGATRSG
ncbi:MAG: YihY family inner membrane protein [Rhodocyclaceae bacterium]|nr:YihY family inner membrane protein [Rhodocyclaceae bacterium]